MKYIIAFLLGIMFLGILQLKFPDITVSKRLPDSAFVKNATGSSISEDWKKLGCYCLNK